ncbi:hypothetical protein HOLleu_00063 [Holothuria leucospilota]|uniref:Integrase p58-like C-terminal domain-containing protein n=1 Tax=Holothuria leucospilota TaxID=206669 RepID=A0A9Q1HK02_HOLLE|nr:hypothetical protein HOLleu_00063 [Holothuria leucospilota]
MFAARESIQESLGFSPFELVFGHTVRGPLKLLKEKWLSDPGEDIHLLDYVSRFKDRLHGACELAQENLRHSQKKMKAWYDKTTVKREFKPGDKVLVFLPVSGQPLQARFQGPYVIERKVSDTDYVILTPDKRKYKRVCHINMMKKYYEREDCDISKDESIHDKELPLIPKRNFKMDKLIERMDLYVLYESDNPFEIKVKGYQTN